MAALEKLPASTIEMKYLSCLNSTMISVIGQILAEPPRDA